jgi:uncharacterized protein
MVNFNDKKIKLTNAQLPLLVLAFAPIFLHGVNMRELFSSVRNTQTPTILPITAQATINGKAIKLEVAKTAITHATGLTHRSDIAADRGMLYRLNKFQPLTFTGGGMEFATDLIFIDKNKVVDSYANIAPCTDKCINYSTRQKYDRVIEVKAGSIQKLEIKNGTEIELVYAGGG